MTLAQAATGDVPYIYLLIPGLLLIIAWLFFSIRGRRKRNAADPSMSATDQIERNRQLRGMRGDLETIMVEIEQMAKRVGHQLDAKAVRLEHLLNQADLKIAQLQQLEQNGDTTARQPAPDTDPHVSPTKPALPSADSPTNHLHQRIYELADAGMPPDQIAHELDEMPGTVELILNLRQA
ncbi:MAG: hypothetical protein AAF586_06745 [Planctomycetota bacterium]